MKSGVFSLTCFQGGLFHAGTGGRSDFDFAAAARGKYSPMEVVEGFAVMFLWTGEGAGLGLPSSGCGTSSIGLAISSDGFEASSDGLDGFEASLSGLDGSSTAGGRVMEEVISTRNTNRVSRINVIARKMAYLDRTATAAILDQICVSTCP